MNILEFDNHPLSALSLHPRKQKAEILYNQTFMSRIYRVIRPMGEKLDFFRPLGFEAKQDFDNKTYKLKPHLITASE